jgi:decaprenylphospho-beta-D-erythro-pentofuranosid-2-ulose 2-reductase
VLAGRGGERLDALVDELRRAGCETVEAVPFDALGSDTHEELIAEVFDRHGDIDVAMIAFGTFGDPRECETDAAQARQVIETNFVGAVSVAVPVVRRLRAQGHGVLVVLSSVAAERARQSEYVYAASKAGLDAFVQGLDDSLHGSGVRTLLVRPGFVLTKMNAGRDPQPWASRPEAVAEAIVRGLERESQTIWVPPWLRWAMAVVRHLPRPLFRRLSAAERRRALD